MLGTIVNALAIIFGSIVGFLLKGGIPEKINDTVMKGLSLCVILIGIKDALGYNNFLLVIFSIAIGGVVGEIIDIDFKLKKLGDKIEKLLNGRGGRVSEGFINASLIYCVGAMAIVGALDSGLKGDYSTLFSKSVIDGISAIVFTSSLGIGVIFSSASVFLYEGIITISAHLLKAVLIAGTIQDISAAGGLLIIGIGINMMGIGKIKIANLLPATFIPIIYELVHPYALGIYHMLVSIF